MKESLLLSPELFGATQQMDFGLDRAEALLAVLLANSISKDEFMSPERAHSLLVLAALQLEQCYEAWVVLSKEF